MAGMRGGLAAYFDLICGRGRNRALCITGFCSFALPVCDGDFIVMPQNEKKQHL